MLYQLSYGRVVFMVRRNARTPNAPPDAALDRKRAICARKTLAESKALALEGRCSYPIELPIPGA